MNNIVAAHNQGEQWNQICSQQSQACGIQQAYQWPYHTNTVYVDRPVPADILIDKVENGFIVTIKDKKYVAADVVAIAGVITIHYVESK